MNMTIYYLDRLEAAYGGASGYRLAKILGVSETTISNYKKQKTFMEQPVALRLAQLINENPAKVIAETQLDHDIKPESECFYRWVLEVSKMPGAPEMPRFHAA